MPSGLRLSLFYAACFVWGGAQLIFWPVWLERRGLTHADVGRLQGIGVVVRAFVCPWIAAAADRRDARRATLRLMTMLALGIAAAFGLAHGFWPLLLVSVAFACCASTMTPLCDSMAVLLQKRGEAQYGRMRMWGSVSFLLTTLVTGVLLRDESPELVVVILLAGLAGAVLAAWTLPDVKAGASERPRGSPLLSVLRLPGFLPAMLAFGCVQASHGAYYSYIALHWGRLGLSAPTIALLCCLGVVAEIVLFTHADRVRRAIGLRGLLLVGSLGCVLRWSLTAVCTSWPALLPIQILHAATFAATQLCAIGSVERMVPAQLVSTAQGVYLALPFGLMMGGSMQLSGLLFDESPRSAYLAMAVLGGLGVLGTIPLRRVD